MTEILIWLAWGFGVGALVVGGVIMILAVLASWSWRGL